MGWESIATGRWGETDQLYATSSQVLAKTITDKYLVPQNINDIIIAGGSYPVEPTFDSLTVTGDSSLTTVTATTATLDTIMMVDPTDQAVIWNLSSVYQRSNNVDITSTLAIGGNSTYEINMVQNGNFSSGMTDWTVVGAVTGVDGKALLSPVVADTYFSQDCITFLSENIVSGTYYRVNYNLSYTDDADFTATQIGFGLKAAIDSPTTVEPTQNFPVTAGTHSFIVKANGNYTDIVFMFWLTGGHTLSVDNVSVIEAGVLVISDGLILPSNDITSSSGLGATGQMTYDSDYLYVCTSGGIKGSAAWKRAALTTW